jgi:hypothetical protein
LIDALVLALPLVVLIGVPLAVGSGSTQKRWPLLTGTVLGGVLAASQASVGEELALLAVPIFLVGLLGGVAGALAVTRAPNGKRG